MSSTYISISKLARLVVHIQLLLQRVLTCKAWIRWQQKFIQIAKVFVERRKHLLTIANGDVGVSSVDSKDGGPRL